MTEGYKGSTLLVLTTLITALPYIPDPLLKNVESTLSAGHGITVRKPHSARQSHPDGPDISRLSPELQSEWMSDKNHHLGNKVIKPYSNCKAWWSCSKCPDGHPHVWAARLDSRSYGKGCPYCSGKEVCKHNSLATKAAVQYWHKEKNLPLTPETVTAGSGFRALWVCPVCSYEWRCQVLVKVQHTSGCPECAKTHGGRSKDGTRQKQPTFASCKHPLLSQWDHDLNAREGNYPESTTLGSNKRIWWTCDQCPKGKRHNWSAIAFNRTTARATGCPLCSHRLLCDCNSLQSLNPTLAADFDSKANGLTPNRVTANSSLKYRWLSDKPGAPLRSVKQCSQNLKQKLERAGRA